MTKVAGEVADGFFLHGFTTPRYLREVTLPALRAGRAAAGKADLDGFQMCGMPFIVTGVDEDAIRAADAATRKQIAFYGSTPAYRPVLDLHGWGHLSEELNRLSKLGEWDEMGRLITDEMVNEIADRRPARSGGRAVARDVWRRVHPHGLLRALSGAGRLLGPDQDQAAIGVKSVGSVARQARRSEA